MLESVDLEQRITKNEYRERKEVLVKQLVKLQQDCVREKLPVVVCVDGWSAAGKGTTISKLVKDLDPRHFRVYAMSEPTETERRYHFLQRYWERVGQYGTITFFDGSWYNEAVTAGLKHQSRSHAGVKVSKRIANNISSLVVGDFSETSRQYGESAVIMERQLVSDGYLVIKCFFHMSEKVQHERLAKLRSHTSTSWRVDDSDLAQNENYDAFCQLFDSMLSSTNFERSPWHVVPADDPRTCRIAFMEVIAAQMEQALQRHREAKANPESIPPETPLPPSRYELLAMPKIETVTHDLRIDDAVYKKQLKAEQRRLSKLQFELYLREIPTMLVFEGWDAAGKGGAIKRITAALDARDYRVVPSASPTQPEKEHPFLWRYWINLPKSGHMRIYDRSWYGRVMVERIEGFCTDDDWRRAFEEINDFEHEMVRAGTLMLKFWIDVSQDEQLNRFNARRDDPEKAWKLTDEDWRNREKYPQYCESINDMLKMTSTDFAPWTIVESDDKHYARVKVLKTLNAAIEKRLSE